MPTSSGCIATAKDVFKDLISNSAAFQTLTGSANASEAAGHIYLEILPRTQDNGDVDFEAMAKATYESKRPFCVIYLDFDAGLSLTHVASGSARTLNADAFYYFEVDVQDIISDVMSYYAGDDAAETAQDYAHYTDNILGTIADQVADNAGDALLTVSQFQREFSELREKHTTGDWVFGMFGVALGIDG